MKICLAVFALITVSASAHARPEFWDDFKKYYEIKDDSMIGKAKCQTCHSRPPQRNPFGRSVRTAYRNAKPGQKMPDVFKAVEDQDSDKDGVKNVDEIKAGYLPGDSTSTPPKKDGGEFVWILPLATIFGVGLFAASGRRPRS